MTTTKPQLAGQRVLVARAAHQAEEQVNLLKHFGAHAIELPMLEIHPTQPGSNEFEQVKQQIINLDHYAIAICASPNAATLALEWIDQYWPELPLGIDWYAIGKSTQTVLAKGGITATCPQSGYDSEATLEAPGLQSLTHKKALILRGSEGRNTLSDTLQQRGAQVTCANLYSRNCPRYDDQKIARLLHQHPLTGALITSGAALANFVKVASGSRRQFSLDSLLGLRLVVPSERIAQQAKQIGFTQVTVAQGPDNLSMVAALDPANDSEANP